MHLDDGQLRAYFDHELNDDATIKEHLAACDACRQRADETAARSARISSHLNVLASTNEPRAVRAPVALARFEMNHLSK